MDYFKAKAVMLGLVVAPIIAIMALICFIFSLKNGDSIGSVLLCLGGIVIGIACFVLALIEMKKQRSGKNTDKKAEKK